MGPCEADSNAAPSGPQEVKNPGATAGVWHLALKDGAQGHENRLEIYVRQGSAFVGGRIVEVLLWGGRIVANPTCMFGMLREVPSQSSSKAGFSM